MQAIAELTEGTYHVAHHWHFVAALNELMALRKLVAAVAEVRGIPISWDGSTPSGGPVDGA